MASSAGKRTLEKKKAQPTEEVKKPSKKKT